MSATPLAVLPAQSDLAAVLAQAAPFADLPAPVLKAIADVSQERSFSAGATIFALGQNDGEQFFFVSQGRLKAAFADPAAGSMLIEETSAGQFFGLAAAIAGENDEGAEALTLAAETDAVVVAIEAAAFRQIVAQRPSLTRNLMQYFAGLLARNATPAAAPDQEAPLRRVFAALIEYVERDAITGEWRIPRMPKHRELAEKAAADEAAAANAVARLIQDGIARRDYPGLVIADMGGLSRLAH